MKFKKGDKVSTTKGCRFKGNSWVGTIVGETTRSSYPALKIKKPDGKVVTCLTKNIVKHKEDSLEEIFSSVGNTAEITYTDKNAVVISWMLKGIGFGDLTLHKKGKKWSMNTEMMSRKSVKLILMTLADSLPIE